MNIPQIAAEAVAKHHALQKPEELACLLYMLKPSDHILEIGCDAGGTTWAFKQIGCDITGITLEHGAFSSGYSLMHKPNTLILGDSHNPDTKKRLARAPFISFDLVFIDGDHTQEGVQSDFEMYSPFSAGMVAFHDICHHDPKLNVGVEHVWTNLIKKFASIEFITTPTDWGGIGVLDFYPGVLDERIDYAQSHQSHATTFQ